MKEEKILRTDSKSLIAAKTSEVCTLLDLIKLIEIKETQMKKRIQLIK